MTTDKRLHLTIDISGDMDDLGLLDYLDAELASKIAELVAGEPLVVDVATWIETY